MEQKKLSEIFDEEQLTIVYKLIKSNEWNSLRTYLNTIKDKLIQKGVVADYIYYVLEYHFKDLKGGRN